MNKIEDIRKTMSAMRAKFDKAYSGNSQFADDVFGRITSYLAGVSRKGRPIGSYLMAGGSGTGKSWAVEALAEAIHGSTENLIYIDGASYHSSHEVARINGAPPGYLGHKETQSVLSKNSLVTSRGSSWSVPVTIVLVDEIDKSHEALHNVLLGILQRGSVITGDVNTVDLTCCLFFLTSNAGTDDMNVSKSLGFSGEKKKRDLRSVMSKYISVPLVNRIDSMYLFKEYTRAEKIAAIRLQCERYLTSITFLQANVKASFFSEVYDTYYTEVFSLRNVVKEATEILRHEVTQYIIDGKIGVLNVSANSVKAHVERQNATIRSTSASG